MIAARVHGPRLGGAAKRLGVGAVRGAAGGADLDGQGLGELVVIEARHQAVDDAQRVVEIRVEEHEGEARYRQRSQPTAPAASTATTGGTRSVATTSAVAPARATVTPSWIAVRASV